MKLRDSVNSQSMELVIRVCEPYQNIGVDKDQELAPFVVAVHIHTA